MRIHVKHVSFLKKVSLSNTIIIRLSSFMYFYLNHDMDIILAAGI